MPQDTGASAVSWALSCLGRAKEVAGLLDAIGKDCEGRPDFQHGMPREMAESAIHALLWAYESRPSDTSCAYAMTNLWHALRVDWKALKFLPAEGIEAAEAGDTPESKPSHPESEGHSHG